MGLLKDVLMSILNDSIHSDAWCSFTNLFQIFSLIVFNNGDFTEYFKSDP